MMRWTDFAQTLPADDYARLVNSLTAGWGYTWLASRAASHNDATLTVRAFLDHALTHLVAARRWLPPPLDTPPPVTGLVVRPARWQELMATLPPGDADRLTQALADAVIDAKRAAEIATTNGSVSSARRYLEAAIERVALIRNW